MKPVRECPACGQKTDAPLCCGVFLDSKFTMTKARTMALRRYAHGRKGLDVETYRMHLEGVGARSTTELTRDQHTALLKRLGALPDKPRPGRGAPA